MGQREPIDIEVPMLDLAAQRDSIRDELDLAVQRVLSSQRFILGPEVEAFEEALASYCGSRHAVGCGSGSDALLLALMAHGIGPGDEVLCPAYSFFATAGSVARLGATPVFVDIESHSYNMCPSDLRRAARSCSRLRAIVPVHLFGQTADLEAITALAEELGVALIEDAAQAIGACDFEGRRAGTRGALGCFSLYPTKNLGAAGDAGALLCDDDELAQRLRELRSHGEAERYLHDEVGINSRLDALQAAILRAKLPHLDAWTRARRENAGHYDDAFLDAGATRSDAPLLADRASGSLPLQVPWRAASPASHVFHQYVVRVPAEHRDLLREHLLKSGVATGVYYPLGLHQQRSFARENEVPRSLPATEAAARETLALPVFPELGRERREHVIDALLEYFAAV